MLALLGGAVLLLLLAPDRSGAARVEVQPDGSAAPGATPPAPPAPPVGPVRADAPAPVAPDLVLSPNPAPLPELGERAIGGVSPAMASELAEVSARIGLREGVKLRVPVVDPLPGPGVLPGPVYDLPLGRVR